MTTVNELTLQQRAEQEFDEREQEVMIARMFDEYGDAGEAFLEWLNASLTSSDVSGNRMLALYYEGETDKDRIERFVKTHIDRYGRSEASDVWSELRESNGTCDVGLSFDEVEPYTFSHQSEGYFRWQFCWGGPASELRYFPHSDRYEFWFLDWFEGHKIELDGSEAMCEVIKEWVDMSDRDEWYWRWLDAQAEHCLDVYDDEEE